tara:strand:+ start:1586 stop:1924 length:339 start_codon:yes stop_codon:yes gene_type:complete
MAFQGVTPTKLSQDVLTTDYIAIYTVPANTRSYVKDICVCNTSAAGVDISISLVPSEGIPGTSNALYYDFTVEANDTMQWKGSQIMYENDTIQVKASATGCTINIGGGEATE